MTKSDIIKRISEETGLDRSVAARAVELMLTSIKDALSSGEAVHLRGFGTFQRKTRAAKPGRDIRKGITVEIPRHDVPHFRPSPSLSDLLK